MEVQSHIHGGAILNYSSFLSPIPSCKDGILSTSRIPVTLPSFPIVNQPFSGYSET